MIKFSIFRKPLATERVSHTRNFEDIHDEHTDAVMNHLQQMHRLTHPAGEWRNSKIKQRKSTSRIDTMHADIGALLHKHGAREAPTF